MGKKYNIIYADPPWKFQAYSQKGSLQKSADCHYSCMQLEDIQNLPVSEIAASDCVLFLWVTFPLLREGLDTLRQWGFLYKTCAFNWVKRNKRAESWFMGLGYWTRSCSEICLLGTKGKPKRISKSVPQICDARIMEHSRKPDEIRERIVELCGDLPRIELFARRQYEGWDCLGNEIDGRDIREALPSLYSKD
ncbi:MAG: DNA methyltransferase [Lachnospiraceae bacterium]|nr:DNA methyltransferase [Lachnospiraceae bacterium]